MMIAFIRNLFLTPEAHRDPYIWAYVFGTHMALGGIGWTFMLSVTENPALATKSVIAFYSVWELAQFIMNRTKTILLDCMVDLVAWSSTSLVLYEIWMNNANNALGYMLGASVTMAVGICKRLKHG